MTQSYTPMQTGFSRVFIVEGGARADHAPVFQSCLKAAAVEQPQGDTTLVWCPSPTRFGEFDVVATVQGARDKATTTLTGHYAADVESTLLRLAAQRCRTDIHIVIGVCTDPSQFNDAIKDLVLEDARLTSWSSGDLGALEPGEAAKVDETSPVSATAIYEILPLAFVAKADSIISNEVMDVVVCDYPQCGECGTFSAGHNNIYAVTMTAGGSPSTPADLVFSVDGGANWYAHDIMSAGVCNPSSICCIGDYVVVPTTVTAALDYALKSEITPTNLETWTAVTTGFTSGKFANDCWSVGNKAFLVGTTGYIYSCTDPTAGVTLLDAGVAAATDDLQAVHALDEYFAVAVGSNGVIVVTYDGTNWTGLTRFVGLGVTLNGVWCKSQLEWWTCSSAGRLYYTLNGGTTWTERGFPGSGSGTCYDVCFANDNVGYLAHSTSTPRARILRTRAAGAPNTWYVLPEGTGSMPLADRFNALACSEYDVNFVVGAGLADNASDGKIVLGED